LRSKKKKQVRGGETGEWAIRSATGFRKASFGGTKAPKKKRTKLRREKNGDEKPPMKVDGCTTTEGGSSNVQDKRGGKQGKPDSKKRYTLKSETEKRRQAW